MSKSTLAVSSLSILFLLWAPAARTQTVSVAEVSGTVTDSSGAAITGAAVSMTRNRQTDSPVNRHEFPG